MIRTQISLTERQAEALQRLAALRRQSQAALLREALDDLLRTDDRQVRIDRAKAVVGLHGSGTGTGTTATEHDAALEEAFGS